MQIQGVQIEDTFAEAFSMVATNVIITAESSQWAKIAADTATGYATSVIACDAEAGINLHLSPQNTPDERPGTSVLFFAFNAKKLEAAVANRVAQCVMTCPTTACYGGLWGGNERIRVGGQLRFFGDGHQQSKLMEYSDDSSEKPRKRRFWRVPVMDGEFVCEDTMGYVKGVAGGNFLILAQSQPAGLAAATAAVTAIAEIDGVITPFPGGIVRSGSKVGSKYKKLRASTNDAYCPTLRGVAPSNLPAQVQCVYEIVIDGLCLDSVQQAIRVGVQAACQTGVHQISAGNYGGNLGPHHLRLHEILQS